MILGIPKPSLYFFYDPTSVLFVQLSEGFLLSSELFYFWSFWTCGRVVFFFSLSQISKDNTPLFPDALFGPFSTPSSLVVGATSRVLIPLLFGEQTTILIPSL